MYVYVHKNKLIGGTSKNELNLKRESISSAVTKEWLKWRSPFIYTANSREGLPLVLFTPIKNIQNNSRQQLF